MGSWYIALFTLGFCALVVVVLELILWLLTPEEWQPQAIVVRENIRREVK